MQRLHQALICYGQLDTLAAAKHAIAAAQLPLNARLEFALWQTLSKLQSQWVNASKRGEIDWSGNESALAFAVASVNTPEAASTILGLLTPERLVDPSTDKLFAAAVNASDAAQLGELLSIALKAPTPAPTRRSDLLDTLLQRTRRDNVVPESAEKR